MWLQNRRTKEKFVKDCGINSHHLIFLSFSSTGEVSNHRAEEKRPKNCSINIHLLLLSVVSTGVVSKPPRQRETCEELRYKFTLINYTLFLVNRCGFKTAARKRNAWRRTPEDNAGTLTSGRSRERGTPIAHRVLTTAPMMGWPTALSTVSCWRFAWVGA